MSVHKRALASDHCVMCGSEHPGTDTTFCSVYDASAPRTGAGIISLSFGYGSRHDTTYLYAVICDSCAKALVEGAAAPFSSGGALGCSLSNTEDMREENDD